MGLWAKAETAVDLSNLRRSSSKQKLETLPCCWVGFFSFLFAVTYYSQFSAFRRTKTLRRCESVHLLLSRLTATIIPPCRSQTAQTAKLCLWRGEKKCKRVLFVCLFFCCCFFLSVNHTNTVWTLEEKRHLQAFFEVLGIYLEPRLACYLTKRRTRRRQKAARWCFEWQLTVLGKKGNKMQTTRPLNTSTGNNTTKQTIISLITNKSFQRKPCMREIDYKSSKASDSSDVLTFSSSKPVFCFSFSFLSFLLFI